jgi:hypothetical protein
MSQKYQVIIQPAAQKAIEASYFWLSDNHASQSFVGLVEKQNPT